jgi:DMSO/TMAO reductase YedYZ molybdopterin-dependent catalytic subunit
VGKIGRRQIDAWKIKRFPEISARTANMELETLRLMLAYAMNGQELPAPHGAPLRVRVPRQLGFKSLKYLSRITLTDTVKNIGKGWGSSSPEHGFSWYGGI